MCITPGSHVGPEKGWDQVCLLSSGLLHSLLVLLFSHPMAPRRYPAISRSTESAVWLHRTWVGACWALDLVTRECIEVSSYYTPVWAFQNFVLLLLDKTQPPSSR